MRYILAIALLTASVAWGGRPRCPPPASDDASRDAYLDAQQRYIGSLQEPGQKAIEQIALSQCVVGWSERAVGPHQPLQPRHKIRARDAALRAKERELTRDDASGLEARLNACPVIELKASPSSWRPIAGWSLVGAGVAGMALGVVFNSASGSAENDYNAAIAAGSSAAVINGHADDAESNANLATTGWIVGGVLMAAGLGLLIWDWTDDAPVRAWVTPQGVGVGGRF